MPLSRKGSSQVQSTFVPCRTPCSTFAVVLADALIHGAAATMTASKNVFIFDSSPLPERSHGTGLEPAANPNKLVDCPGGGGGKRNHDCGCQSLPEPYGIRPIEVGFAEGSPP